MNDLDNLCMKCFEPLTNGSVCENCGWDNDSQTDMMYLEPKTVLNDRYVVGALIKHESDAAVYAAYDKQLDEKVCLREFLPKGIANRLEGNSEIHVRERYRNSFDSYKESFINLWSTLIKMKNLSAVIPTFDVFEQNGTAYAVSEYMDSITLREFLLRNPDGNVLWDQARIMFMPVLTTLEALHNNGIIHGAICPDNLLLCRDGKVRLKGFCITQANYASTDLDFVPNDGYTALEQYDNNRKICPATDIYAFSACIFRALVGQNPPPAKSREVNDKLMIPNAIAEKIPTHIIKALGGGLQIYAENRTQSIDVFREQLNASPSVMAAAQQEIEKKISPKADEYKDPVEEEEHYRGYPGYDDEKSKKPALRVAIVVLVILVVAAAVIAGYLFKSGKLGNEQQTTVATTAVEKYTVPDFVSAGYTQSDIENNGAWNSQFKISFTSDYSADVEEGLIFKQSVKSGESIDRGSEIVLTVSKGVKTAEVPDVGGLSVEEATKELEKAGFKVSTVEIYNDGGEKEGTVKSHYGMAPAAHETVAVGEEIILQVYGEVVTTTTQPSTENESQVNE